MMQNRIAIMHRRENIIINSNNNNYSKQTLMKQKVLSILALLLVAVTGAWAVLPLAVPDDLSDNTVKLTLVIDGVSSQDIYVAKGKAFTLTPPSGWSFNTIVDGSSADQSSKIAGGIYSDTFADGATDPETLTATLKFDGTPAETIVAGDTKTIDGVRVKLTADATALTLEEAAGMTVKIYTAGGALLVDTTVNEGKMATLTLEANKTYILFMGDNVLKIDTTVAE